MEGDESESLSLPLDYFQTTSTPMSELRLEPSLNHPPSISLPRKSINWARPVATSMQKKLCDKRISTRFSEKYFRSTCLRSGSINNEAASADKNCKETVQSSVVQALESRKIPIRIVSFGSNRRKHKLEHKALEATVVPNSEQQQLEGSNVNCCLVQETGPNSQSRNLKKARLTQGCALESASDELQEVKNIENIHAENLSKEWVSVPLDSMEAADRNTPPNEGKTSCKTQDTMNSEANESSLRRPADGQCDAAPTKSTTPTEVHRNLASCSLNTAYQEQYKYPKRCYSKKKSISESRSESESKHHDSPYRELCKVVVGFKKVVHDMDVVIHELRDNQFKALRKENTRIVDMAVLERERLRNEISELLQKNTRVMAERLAIERDMGYNMEKMEASRESLRVQLEREHAEVVAALNMELAKEQEKTVCQICFTQSRDALILPCMHFQYCEKCVRELKECPTCRGRINGLLRCNLCTS
ncbi:unnamed protein product [Calypogeia fissa]